MTSLWDERFAGEEFLFGTEPADFLRREARRIAVGARVLSVADGEGRNSVFLGRQGAFVTAMDSSVVALEKARRFAAREGVDVDFRHSDIADWHWEEAAFDAVLAVFIQFAPPALRDKIFAGIARTLRPGGLLLLHGYAPRQVGYGTGGPGKEENLYTLPMLREAFAGFEVLNAADYDADISEGRGHSGRSALIDFVALKPGQS
ncbi:class I SAM-dependent methyltransferase [Ostreiculturibacter nitratireducens]|uniref:SAM-dependent methyltransferase n=1 Tax=Ostreiculturibacter nitratireducens TaxID=3075226 RepID=UPI0031B56599